MHDPQQELFTELLIRLRAEGLSVYDGELPPEETPYPFVFMGDCQQVDSDTKTQVIGNVFQTVHVWHNKARKRGTVSQMLATIRRISRSISHTENFAWNVRNLSQRLILDNTTKIPLIHGIVEIEFYFS